MKKYFTHFSRSSLIESSHEIKVLVKNINGKILKTSNHDNDYIYPRSSIKIFQGIAFLKSNAANYFKLSPKIIALSCSSHRGESFHIRELEKWIKKIGISKQKLKCGIHNPLNSRASEKLMRSNGYANQLHNNCAGKHLGMISSCIVNKYRTDNYLEFNHPHQINIRKIFEKFMNKKITKKNYGIDGCSAPQYSFKIEDIVGMLNNVIKSYNGNYEFSYEVKKIIKSVISNPEYIGGTDSIDSKIMKISQNKIFCKGGAEGVFLFIDLKNQLSGLIKVVDGNERAIPPIIYNLFKQLNIMKANELKKLQMFCNFDLINHAKIKVGSVKVNI